MNRHDPVASAADSIRFWRRVSGHTGRCRVLGFVAYGLFLLGFLPAGWAVQVDYVPTDYPVPSTVKEAVRRQLPRLIQSHHVLFHRRIPADLKVQIQVVRTRQEFEAIIHALGFTEPATLGFSHTSKIRQVSSGLFQIQEARIYAWAQLDEAVLTSILLHELTHALTDACVWRAPDWYMEGSAELLGAPAAGLYRLKRQTESQRWQVLREYLQKQKLPGLREFMRASRHDWNHLFPHRPDLGYTAAYSLFHFFMAHPAATRLLMSAVNSPEVALADNPSLGCANYLDRHSPGGLPRLEKGWHEWIQRQAETNGTPAEPARSSSKISSFP